MGLNFSKGVLFQSNHQQTCVIWHLLLLLLFTILDIYEDRVPSHPLPASFPIVIKMLRLFHSVKAAARHPALSSSVHMPRMSLWSARSEIVKNMSEKNQENFAGTMWHVKRPVLRSISPTIAPLTWFLRVESKDKADSRRKKNLRRIPGLRSPPHLVCSHQRCRVNFYSQQQKM